MIANDKDPFASDNDWSDASSILSHYEFCPQIFSNIIENQDSLTESSASSVTSSESEIIEIEESEESIYQSVSSGLGERIDNEIERLEDLSMEVIPLELI